MREHTSKCFWNSLFLMRTTDKMEGMLLDDLRKACGTPPLLLEPKDDQRLPWTLPGGPWDHRTFVNSKRVRYTMAVIGSLILVGPMVLMVLVPSMLARLLTAGISTLLFAAAAAFFVQERSAFELLGATAAYTAVLVVFVGTTSHS